MNRSDIREMERIIGIKERKLESFRNWFSAIKNMPENRGKEFSAFNNKLERDTIELKALNQKLASVKKG
jgi:aspartate ammonia-lyase